MQKVIIYTTPTCPYCKMSKEFFKANSVAYEEKDVSNDESALNEMLQKSGQMGVPVIDIDGQIVVGFDEKKLRELLNK
ncbi:MAG: NrdH-redoxin [Candidatus Parcubacteria bacterium]|nr:MAG: NrdH-redoxin [Candidatus Parcubacteria bacterium]